MLAVLVIVVAIASTDGYQMQTEDEYGVSCGHHFAPNCAACPQGHGASWCNGDCRWCGGSGVCHAIGSPCPINGVWSSWSSYGTCSKTCGAGTQTRSRSCNNPPPSNGGPTCHGTGQESRACNQGTCAVNGAWGSWSSYGSCSKTCGAGTQTRSRSCNNPPPSNGGSVCHGKGQERKSCNHGTCYGRTYECRWLSGRFGATLTCPSSYVATGACGSGALGDCGFFIWTKLKCCRITSGTNSQCSKKQGGYGSVLTCPSQMVVKSLCESGAAGDCGWFIWNRINCCRIQGHTITSACRWKHGGYGAHLTCDGGQIMTGACGSGTGLDCPNRSAHGIKCCNFGES